jgi:hypothetical protein
MENLNGKLSTIHIEACASIAVKLIHLCCLKRILRGIVSANLWALRTKIGRVLDFSIICRKLEALLVYRFPRVEGHAHPDRILETDGVHVEELSMTLF